MVLVAFDTLDYVKELEGIGISRDQAEVQAKAMNKAMQSYDQNTRKELVTKGDIQDQRLEMKDDIFLLERKIDTTRLDLEKKIDDVRTELKEDIQRLDKKIDNIHNELKILDKKIEATAQLVPMEILKLENRLTLRLGVMMAASVAMIAALVKWL